MLYSRKRRKRKLGPKLRLKLFSHLKNEPKLESEQYFNLNMLKFDSKLEFNLLQ